MPSTKEIKDRIESVRQTQKITNAMYLISSTKLRRARADLEHTRPYFEALQAEIKRIFRTSSDILSRYFYRPTRRTSRAGPTPAWSSRRTRAWPALTTRTPSRRP